MQWVDLAGYIASSLVFLTFYMRDMISLRVVALCSNLAFLIYGGALHLTPIFILHTALIPINARRLLFAVRQRGSTGRCNRPVLACTLSSWRVRPGRPKKHHPEILQTRALGNASAVVIPLDGLKLDKSFVFDLLTDCDERRSSVRQQISEQLGGNTRNEPAIEISRFSRRRS